MAHPSEPKLEISQKALPPPLLLGLAHVFAQGISGSWLAGGTALAGFYAGHRRSDDLDFFTASEPEQKSTVLAIESLAKIGGEIEPIHASKQYYEALARLHGHRFKITAVLDENLFRVGGSCTVSVNMQIADLETLFKMKAATLVSRCGEKDLFDLIWLFRRFPGRGFSDLVRLGREIDAGADGEAMLASLGGAILREAACDFSLLGKGPAEVFAEITAFREELQTGLARFLDEEPVPPLGQLLKKLKQWKK